MGSGWESRRRALRALHLAVCAVALALAGCGGPLVRGQAAGVTAAGATATVAPPAGMTLTRDLAYGPLPAERLDLCLPQRATIPRPAVVLIHGGGWWAGDKTDFAARCGQLAALGFIAVTVDYRLSQDAAWPAQIVDVQLAARWLRAQADRLSLDPARVCAWGFSAGGHLAALLGELYAIHPGDEASLYADQSPKATCVVDEAGPADLAAVATEPLHGMERQLFGGMTAAQNPAAYRDASPALQAAPRAAPTLIAQGTRDTTVPPAQSQALLHALQAVGVSARLLSFDGGHEREGLTRQQSDALDAQLVAFVQARLGA